MKKNNDYLDDELLVEDLIDVDKENERQLILYNDDWHSFDYVIDSLVKVCRHNTQQAEQCAMITHHNGKCDVKSGSYSSLKPLKERLIERKLIVDIE